ncbi:MAG: hypothetical protein Tsb0033_29040 [Winogradskyella sp.]
MFFSVFFPIHKNAEIYFSEVIQKAIKLTGNKVTLRPSFGFGSTNYALIPQSGNNRFRITFGGRESRENLDVYIQLFHWLQKIINEHKDENGQIEDKHLKSLFYGFINDL